MATFISLINWTDQGIRQYPDSLRRAEAATQLLQRLDGGLKDVYWTMGSHDLVAIVEAPDAETATAAFLAIGAQGNIRTQTLRAFSREEMQGIIDKVMPAEET
ncbi:MAG: GYD domain-containing protein [Actinomycetota bacterium]|nr:GYD domain-containing protein [Actinomycetota bacterium]